MQEPRRRKSDNGHTKAVVGLASVLIAAALVAFGAAKSNKLDATERLSQDNHTQIEVLNGVVDVRLRHIEGDLKEIKEHVLKE